MLKVEYPCREILSSYQNPPKSIITWNEAKKHLHDVRLRRQQQLTTNINECHKLHTLHKQIYNRQFESSSIEKSSEDKSLKSTSYDYSTSIKKYSLPRIEYAPIIYRQAIPTFEVETSSKLETDTPIISELTQYLSETSSKIPSDKIENSRSLSPIQRPVQRKLSVSSVSSADKRANKVYEKWPDYNHISELVGFRIDPPAPKLITSNSISSRPSGAAGLRKRNSSIKFPMIAKEIKNLTSLYPSPLRKDLTKSKSPKKSDITPVIIDKPSTIIEKVVIPNRIKENKSKLPDLLCPSSIAYSKRIQTRQWLMKNDFASHPIQTLPLL